MSRHLINRLALTGSLCAIGAFVLTGSASAAIIQPVSATSASGNLSSRPIDKTIVETHYEHLDEVMAGGDGERPWQHFELTQRLFLALRLR